MITPGRAACSTTFTSSRVRSISILGMPANLYFSVTYLRILWSSINRLAYSFLEAYQRLFQPIMMPVRKLTGLIFWPIRLFHRDGYVSTSAGDDVGHATGSRSHSLKHRATIDAGVLHYEATDVRRPQIFRVAERAFDQLLEHPRPTL